MRKPGPEEWKQLIAEFETSGMSHKDFIAKHDVSLGTFQFWLYRLRKKARTRSSESNSDSLTKFLPIDVVASPASSTRAQGGDSIELGLLSGNVLRFAVGTDVRYV